MQTGNKAIEQALQLLYGQSETPVCAVDASFSIVWQSDSCVSRYLTALYARLQVSTTDGTLLLPVDGLVDCVLDGVLLRCRLTKLPAIALCTTSHRAAETGYLIQFEPTATANTPMDLELRTFLASSAETVRSSVASVLQATQLMHDALAVYQAAEDAQPAFDTVATACYQMLHQSARATELAWYAAADDRTPDSFPVVDLTTELERFVGRLRQITNGALLVETEGIASDLAAHLETKRLLFALLTMVVLVQDGCASRTRLLVSASRTPDAAATAGANSVAPLRTIDVRIAALEAGSDANTRLHAPQLRMAAGHFLSMQALMQRFCDTFGAQWMLTHTEEGSLATLRLPAAPTASVLHTSTAAPPFAPIDRFSVYQILLSEILRFPYAGTSYADAPHPLHPVN